MANERRETCNLCDVKNKWFDRESTNLVQSSTLAKILFFFVVDGGTIISAFTLRRRATKKIKRKYNNQDSVSSNVGS